MTGLAETPTAIRTRRMRDRRRRGYRVAKVEIGRRDTQALVAAGALGRAQADDMDAVEAAIGIVLDQLTERHA